MDANALSARDRRVMFAHCGCDAFADDGGE
jgi:hypothetical protein